MYRDVKKKLLSVALCICMIIGMVQVVPRAKAAAEKVSSNVYKVRGYYNNGSEEIFNITVDYTEFSYDGAPHQPRITNIAHVPATSESYNFKLTEINPIDADNYTVPVVDPNGSWTFHASDAIPFSITKRSVSDITVRSKDGGALIVDYTGSAVYPQKEDLIVQAICNGTPVTLNDDQYELSAGSTQVGTNAKCTVTLTDTNYNASPSTQLTYVIAYNLGKTTGYKASLASTEYDFGSVIQPVIKLENQLDPSDVIEVRETSSYKNYFQLSYYKLTKNAEGEVISREEKSSVYEAGDYEVVLSPRTGSYTTINENIIFTGTYTGTLSVKRLDASTLTVTALNNEESTVTLSDPSYKLKLPFKGQGVSVVPQGVVVEDSNGNNITSFCTITTRNADKAGKAWLIITPDQSKTNYSGTYEIEYYIVSSIYVYSFRFAGMNAGQDHIIYDGNPHVLGTGEDDCIVYNGSDGRLVQGSNRDYTVSYEYTDNGIDWYPSSESDLASVGQKRIKISGCGNIYAGVECVQEYWIDPVNIDVETYRNKCSVELDKSEYYYTGKAIIPKFTFNYNGMPIGTSDDPKNQFTYEVTNNIDAGTSATLTIHMSGLNFKGTYTKTFTIKKLPIASAVVTGSCIYDGTEKEPVIKIEDSSKGIDYTLNQNVGIKDYEVTGYRKQGASEWSSNKPIDAGNYQMQVEIVNDNISCPSGTTVIFDYTIDRCNINSLRIYIDEQDAPDGEIEWNGGATNPRVVVPRIMTENDYTLSYIRNTVVTTDPASKAAIHVDSNASKNFVGERDLFYTITQRELTEDNSAFSFETEVSGTVPGAGYTIDTIVTDAGRKPAEKELTLGTDYTVSLVRYYNDSTEKWEKLTEGTDYTVSGNTVTQLKRAGKYEITINGKEKYTGSLIKEVTCGTDISGYRAYIDNISESRFTYDNTEKKPTSFSLYNAKDKPVSDISYNKDDLNASDFQIDYERTDGGVPVNTAAGKIYVIAIGNPDRGYFGRTEVSEKEYSFYTINAPIWSQGTFEIIVATNGGITYQPEGATIIPYVTVKFEGDTLIEGKDYELRYNKEELQTAGLKTILIDGINNYDDQANKNWPAEYEVAPVDVDSSAVKKIPTSTDYTNINQGGITLKHSNYILVEGKDKDYTRSIVPVGGKNVVEEAGKYYVTYLIKGHGNYTGETTVKIPVNVVDLSDGQATFASSAAEAKAGEFYVRWDQSELLIKDANLPEKDRIPVTPSAFTIVYKLTDTDEVALKKDEDYKILTDSYGSNNTAGSSASNYVTIEGIGGYTNTRQLKFTLYTQMKDATPTDTSLIKDGNIITKTEWKKVYDQAGEEGLLKLNPLSFDESDYINPAEYKLDWVTGFDPADPDVGNYTVRVIGLQEAPHYYYGSITLTFTIVDGIENAQITVRTDDTVPYKGNADPVVVTAPGIGIKVVVDGRELIRDTDYVITGYSGNDSIGTATVFLQGIGKYSGTAQHDFRVTYPINSLVVFMKDATTDEWVNCAEETVRFKYTGNPIEPEIKLYCPLDKPADGNYLNTEPLSPSLYGELGYVNNVDAGKGSVIIKDSPFFTDGSANPQRYVNFIISEASICPPSEGGTVSYRSSLYGNVENIVAEYMGESYTAEDLGITLHDRTLDLEENKDYLVYYDGDTLNVSDPTALPMITFTGAGNYKGSEHKIHFSIVEKAISDTNITAEPVLLTYTDSALEQQIIDRMNVVLQTPKGREEKLVCGTDFQIEKYYTDAACNRPVSAATGVPNDENTYYIPSAQGTYYVKINGINNFKGSRVVRIDIEKRDLSGDIKINFVPSDNSECTIDSFGEPDCMYDGKEHKPAIEVTYGINNVRLIEERDYTVAYNNNMNAGTEASVTVTMINGSNYAGEATRYFTIKPKDITGEDMAYRDGAGNAFQSEVVHEWTKNPVRPSINVYDKSLNTTLTPIVAEGAAGDYLVVYEDDNQDDNTQVNAGQVTMTIKGQGNYTGTQEFTYYIGEDISQSYTLVNGRSSVSVDYNGLVQAPDENDITVVWGASSDLTDANGEKRYDIAYYKDGFEKSNIVTRDQIVNAGTYYVAVIGVPSKGTYAKSSVNNSCTYTINPRSIAPSYILVSGYDGTYYYTGQQIQPKGIAVEDTDLPVTSDANDPQRRTVKLINGTDYDLSYTNNVAAGKASIIVTGKGNYTGSRVAYFNILSSDVDGNNTWDGSSEGTGSITNGSTTIAASDIILGYDNSAYDCMMYNGYERIPTVTINGISSNEFIITASNNIRPGIATLTITGKGNNFTGTIIKNYKIKANLASYGTIATIADQVYTGYQITPHVTLTCGGNLLNQGSDYTVTYLNNTNVGKATVMATATNDSYYIGSVTGSFNISNTAGGMEITGYGCAYTYTGYPITPDIVVTMNGRVLTRGTDYAVSYSNNTNVGTATMTVTGIGSFSGTKTITYSIEAKNIENCLTTAVTNYQYTGSTYTPNVTVTDSSTGKTLVAGTDYTITYSNNTNPGTASITVTALSKNYTGSKVIPFKITSAAVSGLRTSTIKNNSIKLAWTAQDYADGYQICNSSNRVVATTSKNSYTVKGLTSCTTYKFKVRSYVENADGSVSYGDFSTAVSAKTLLNTPTLTAKSTSKGKVRLTWTKVSKATGYEIYYSTKKNGIYTRLKTVSASSSRKYVDSGLASGEKYYYTIRAYRTTNGVKTYSSYNTVKSVKVK